MLQLEFRSEQEQKIIVKGSNWEEIDRINLDSTSRITTIII